MTNRSWGHLWIHESYATYLAARFCGHYYGDDVFAKEMYDAGTTAEGTDTWGGRNPIANGKGTTANIYQRGARVLQMLCQLVGEDQFWRANQFFLQRHAHGLVESNDLKLAFEDATGLNLDWFFQQRQNDVFYEQYLAGVLDSHAYIDFATRPWRHRKDAELAAVSRLFVEHIVRPALPAASFELAAAP